MNVGQAIKDKFFRVDARSLGLFRIAIALVLFGDLLRRWAFLRAFYSNEGVLPNHNHLFNLRDSAQVWSFLHAFSSPGENHFAFALIALVYLLLLVGWQTRVFQALALVCLVSLTGRNILLENAGNYAAIALLAFTLFLPLGSRFSLDALVASMRARDEKRASELNDRGGPDEAAILAARAPGWSPASLAGFAAVAQIAIIYLVTALQQRGAWKDGTALYYALQSERWVSGLGASVRALPAGLLSAWTHLLYAAEWAIPALIVVPVARRYTRGAAAALSLIYGLTLGLFFSFGLYGWTLVAASALLLPRETWERVEGQPRPARRITVIYDADCGVCLFLARVLKRLDLRQQVTFQGNDDLEGLLVQGGAERASLPKEITAELVVQTVVVVDRAGRVRTRSAAVAAAIGALPLGWAVAWVLRVPGIAQLADWLYDRFAARRQDVSVLIGKGVCGVAPADEAPAEEEAPAAVAPATRTARFVSGSLREAAALLVFVAALAQTSKANNLSFAPIPQGKVLLNVAAWPRMLAKWDVLVPEPPREDEIVVVDAQTRAGKSIDPITGGVPQFDPGALRGTGLGQLWGDYLDRMRKKEWFDFQKAFRDYLAKGGPAWEDRTGDEALTGLDAYLIKQPIPAPGVARAADTVAREKLFTHSRGGRLGLDKGLPILRPDLRHK